MEKFKGRISALIAALSIPDTPENRLALGVAFEAVYAEGGEATREEIADLIRRKADLSGPAKEALIQLLLE